MTNIVFFTGSGISAESGIQTFREAGTGLWENFRIEEVCTHEAMLYNRDVVIDFYNHMRKQLLTKQPNEAHLAIARLQKDHPQMKIHIVTQNVDDLHERAERAVYAETNSSADTDNRPPIVHLHGELMRLRGSLNEEKSIGLEDCPELFENGWEQRKDDRFADGSLLRPFIVFFGESVPMMVPAIELTEQADVLVVVGTSLAVYPAASLLHYAKPTARIYCIDPNEPEFGIYKNRIEWIQEKASVGVPKLCQMLGEEM